MTGYWEISSLQATIKQLAKYAELVREEGNVELADRMDEAVKVATDCAGGDRSQLLKDVRHELEVLADSAEDEAERDIRWGDLGPVVESVGQAKLARARFDIFERGTREAKFDIFERGTREQSAAELKLETR